MRGQVEKYIAGVQIFSGMCAMKLDFWVPREQGTVDLWVMGIYWDLFSPGSFIINPCFDLWGFMGIYGYPFGVSSVSVARSPPLSHDSVNNSSY